MRAQAQSKMGWMRSEKKRTSAHGSKQPQQHGRIPRNPGFWNVPSEVKITTITPLTRHVCAHACTHARLKRPCTSIHTPMCVSVHTPMCVSIHTPMCVSIHTSTHTSISDAGLHVEAIPLCNLPIHTSVHTSVHMPVHMSAHTDTHAIVPSMPALP